MRKLLFFLAYIIVSISIIVLSFKGSSNVLSKVLISAIMFFFLVALEDHFIEIRE